MTLATVWFRALSGPRINLRDLSVFDLPNADNVAVRTISHLIVMVPVALILFVIAGCGDRAPSAPPASAPPASPPPKRETGEISPELGNGLSQIINDETTRFRPLEYQYDEDLLKKIDQLEAYLSGTSTGAAPRAMPTLSEQEELDHFRETIERWQVKTGKKLQPEIHKLKAEVAARLPNGPRFYPEFHKQFAAVFDDFIKLEVEEIRERRNRAIHAKAKPLFDRFRDAQPQQVREFEATLNSPPYTLPAEKPKVKSASASDGGA